MRRWGLRQGLGLACVTAAAGVIAGLLVGRAGAGGVPSADNLLYSGTLIDAAGTAVSGVRSLQLQVWDRPSAGTLRCSVPASDQTISAGHFSLQLPPECATAVHDTPNLWLEVSVDGASLGRTKLGSVPYALEAGHSVSADQARGATGELADRLSAIERTRVITAGYDKPLKLCRGTTPIGGTDWQLLTTSQMRVTVDMSSCGYTQRPLILSELSGAARHNRIEGGTNPAPPSGDKDEAKAFDIVIYDPTAQFDPVSANADQWHIAWVAIGD